MLLYTRYVFLFQAAGLILLVAMIGAIVLTLRKQAWVKRQDVLKQMYRDPKTAVQLVDIKPGQGADDRARALPDGRGDPVRHRASSASSSTARTSSSS